MTIGDRIRAARKAKGYTQKQLGEACGIAEPTIRRYELGKLNPKFETLQKIAKPLGVSAAKLYGVETLPEDFLFNIEENYIRNKIDDETVREEALQYLQEMKAKGLTVDEREKMEYPFSELFTVLHLLGYTEYTEEEIMPPPEYSYDDYFVSKDERTEKFYICSNKNFYNMADEIVDYIEFRLYLFFNESEEIVSMQLLEEGRKRAAEYLEKLKKGMCSV